MVLDKQHLCSSLDQRTSSTSVLNPVHVHYTQSVQTPTDGFFFILHFLQLHTTFLTLTDSSIKTAEMTSMILCLVAAIISPAICYPATERKLGETPQGITFVSINSSHFKEPSETDSVSDSRHPNSVYYTRDLYQGPTYRFSDGSTLGNKDEEDISTSDSLYNNNYNTRNSQEGIKENTQSQIDSNSNQAKLYEALRNIALQLEAIQIQRQQQKEQQQHKRKGAPPPKPEVPVYNVKNEGLVPEYTPFTPELLPRTNAGPLSILEELGGPSGSLW